jgi:trimeric autotransporter adhesin
LLFLITAITSTATSVASGSLVGSDTLGNSSVTSNATTTSNVGSYSLTPSGVAFTSGIAANYTISYVDGTLQITPAPLTIIANDATKRAGAPNPTFTATYSGLVSGDTTSSLTGTLTLTTPATTASPAGNYTIKPSGQSSPNYSITYINGILTITQPADQYNGALTAAYQSSGVGSFFACFANGFTPDGSNLSHGTNQLLTIIPPGVDLGFSQPGDSDSGN